MFFIFIATFMLLLTQSLSASITISNGINSSVIDSLIEQAANVYFKPLEEYRKELVKQGRSAWLDKTKIETVTPSSSEKKEETKIVIQPNIEILKKHAEKKSGIKSDCINYCDYILKDQEKTACTPIENLLKEPLSCFWKINSIEIFCTLNDSFNTLKDDTIKLEASFKTITVNDNQFNTDIQSSIDFSLNTFKQKCADQYNAKREELYRLIQSRENRLVFAMPNFDSNYHTLTSDICKKFFKKIFEGNVHIDTEFFFNLIFDIFLIRFYDINFSNNMDVNRIRIQSFFESIIAHQILFSGCSDYIDSLADQHYPDNITAAVKKFILDEALRLYQSWLDGSRNVDYGITLNTLIQQNAMTEVSSFYKATIEDRIKAQNPQMSHEDRDYWANLFQMALFDGIYFADYPQLDKTFNQAFDDFDANNPHYNNQAIINHLVLNAHAMVQQGTTPTKWHYLSKWAEKKYYAKKPLFVALLAVVSFFLIIRILKKIRGFY